MGAYCAHLLSLFKQIDNLLIFFCFGILICFICTAVLPCLREKDYVITLINHCAVAIVNAFIPVVKGWHQINDLVIVLIAERAGGFVQVAFLRHTINTFDMQRGLFCFELGYDLVAKMIKVAKSAKIKMSS